MSNHATPQNDAPKYVLTTQSLGIADANAKDLAGFMLNADDLSTATIKILINVGINADAIRCVKVGSDADGNLKILAEILKKSLSKKKKVDTSWIELDDHDHHQEKTKLPKEFYSTLKNKVYYKHLKTKEVMRSTSGGKGKHKKNHQEKYIQIEFDPEILIAFVYNLDYTDPCYKVSCKKLRWLNQKELEKKYDSNKKIRKYNAVKNEYLSDKLYHCRVVVTHSINKKRMSDMYYGMLAAIAKGLSAPDATDGDIREMSDKLKSFYNKDMFMKNFNDALSSGDFHPKQVPLFEGDDEDDED